MEEKDLSAFKDVASELEMSGVEKGVQEAMLEGVQGRLQVFIRQIPRLSQAGATSLIHPLNATPTRQA